MLSNTGCVILGLLQKQPMSGYDIKNKVDISTSFFFPASYSQIYPELKKLEAEGLIEGEPLSTGKRPRTEYAITAAGRKAFAKWLARPSAEIELRDEGLLKFFFAGGLDREQLLAKLESLKQARMAELARLHEIGADMPEIADELQHASLEYGIGLYEYAIGWCDRMIGQLASRPPKDFPVDPQSTPG